MMQNNYSNPYATAQNRRAAYEIQKRDLFRDYELMDQDPIIASALDIYSDESTIDNIEGETLKVKSENVQVQKILHLPQVVLKHLMEIGILLTRFFIKEKNLKLSIG